MGKEVHHSWGKTIRNGIIATALLYPPIVNPDISRNIFRAMLGQEVTCSSVENPADQYPYDIIAVPGAGLYFDPASESYKPSSFERRRLKAAALLYIHGYAPDIVLLSGKYDYERDATASLQYLQRQVSELSGGATELTAEHVAIDGTSINTGTNIRELTKMTDGRVLITDDDYHSLRTILYACASGVDAEMMTVEETFESLYPGGTDQITIPHSTFPMTLRKTKEGIEIAEFLYDRDVYLPTKIKEIMIRNRK